MDHIIRRSYIFINLEYPRYLQFLLLPANKFTSSQYCLIVFCHCVNFIKILLELMSELLNKRHQNSLIKFIYYILLIYLFNKISTRNPITKTSEKRNDAIYWRSIHWVNQANVCMSRLTIVRTRRPFCFHRCRVKLSLPWARRKRKGEMPRGSFLFLIWLHGSKEYSFKLA